MPEGHTDGGHCPGLCNDLNQQLKQETGRIWEEKLRRCHRCRTQTPVVWMGKSNLGRGPSTEKFVFLQQYFEPPPPSWLPKHPPSLMSALAAGWALEVKAPGGSCVASSRGGPLGHLPSLVCGFVPCSPAGTAMLWAGLATRSLTQAAPRLIPLVMWPNCQP